jgi:Na+/H+ antiporter NhaA
MVHGAPQQKFAAAVAVMIAPWAQNRGVKEGLMGLFFLVVGLEIKRDTQASGVAWILVTRRRPVGAAG